MYVCTCIHNYVYNINIYIYTLSVFRLKCISSLDIYLIPISVLFFGIKSPILHFKLDMYIAIFINIKCCFCVSFASALSLIIMMSCDTG